LVSGSGECAWLAFALPAAPWPPPASGKLTAQHVNAAPHFAAASSSRILSASVAWVEAATSSWRPLGVVQVALGGTAEPAALVVSVGSVSCLAVAYT
jgi:hypothetical protein